MASKSAHQEAKSAEDIEAVLDAIDQTLDRVKVLYEQYFLGIQKQPPAHLHNDVERKLRELTQIQIRNTALRYRFATLQQKFGSYNTYWRRTLRQIENGTYARSLSKLSRDAARKGADIPEEILAAMPKRMRDQVRRDREAAAAQAARRGVVAEVATDEPSEAAVIQDTPPPEVRRPRGAHVLDESDADLDIDAFFASVITESVDQAPAAAPPPPPRPAAPPRTTGAVPVPPLPVPPGVSQRVPRAASEGAGVSQPVARVTGAIPRAAASQATRPIPVMPGASANRTTPVETMSGPFPRPRSEPRAATEPPARPTPSPVAQRPPPGMTDADVNALYNKYVQAKQAVGERPGPGEYGKLLKTINAQAPKIMEQYKAKGVDFTVVVKDKQVIIRAKPKP